MAHHLFRGDVYRDDRMYVMRLTSKFTRESDGAIVAEIKAEPPLEDDKPVVLLTYRNVSALPAVRADEFPSASAAFHYIKKIEPTCPRISLGGRSPEPTPSWQEHLEWLHKQGIRSVAEGDAPTPDWIEEEGAMKELLVTVNK